jgi:hypothetical protein
MIKLLMTFIIFFSTTLYSAVPPENETSGTEYEINLRVFYKLTKNLKLLSDFKYRNELKPQNINSFRVGSYLRLFKNLKAGLFYQRDQANRHDDDWLKEGDAWVWTDTSNRVENKLVFDLTPRILLDFIPGKKWVFELKTRYVFSDYQNHQTLKLRPGLTYFYMKDNKPFLNFFLQYEMYLPVNFSNQSIYEKWIYLGSLYHFNKNLKLGFYLANRSVTWEESTSFKVKWPTANYTSTQKTNLLGLNIITFY